MIEEWNEIGSEWMSQRHAMMSCVTATSGPLTCSWAFWELREVKGMVKGKAMDTDLHPGGSRAKSLSSKSATVLQPQEKATVPCSGVTPWSIVQKLLRYRSGVLPTTQGNAWHLSTRTVESNPECVRESPWAPEIPPIMIFLHPTRTLEAVSLQLSLTL